MGLANVVRALPSEWPMFQHDLTHTGYSTSWAPSTNETLWTYTLGTRTNGKQPTIADGRVYFGAFDGIYCLDATTSAFLWSYIISGTWLGIFSAPAVADGRVYTGCNDGRVYCFNAVTGALIWNTAVLTNYFPSHPVVDSGRVYIGGADNLLFFCLDAATGATLWTYPTHGNCYDCSPAVADGFVYFTDSWGRTVYCLNAVTGAFKWTYTLGYNGGWGSTAVVNGIVYLGSTDNRVIALDAGTGALVWSYTTGAEVYGSPAVVDGKLYIGSFDYNVYCLNAVTGAFIWSYKTSTAVCSSPAVADGKVYIASYDGNLYCLNAATGAFIWSYTGLGNVGGKSPSIVNGIVYMLTSNDPGQLLAFGGYYLTVKTDPPGTATISGEGWYDPGTPVTLTAPTGPPGATLSFLNWDLDGTPETANPLVVTMSGPHTATAHYYKIPVGGEWAPIDTAQIVTPWIALAFLAIAFAAAGSHRLLKKRW